MYSRHTIRASVIIYSDTIGMTYTTVTVLRISTSAVSCFIANLYRRTQALRATLPVRLVRLAISHHHQLNLAVAAACYDCYGASRSIR